MTPEMERLGYVETGICVYCERLESGHVGPDYCVRYAAATHLPVLLATKFLSVIRVPI